MLPAVLLAVVVVQFVLLALLYRNFEAYKKNDQAAQEMVAGATFSVVQAVAYKQAAVVPDAGAVYIPEAHLKLPINDDTVQLAYSMRIDGSKDGPRSLYVVSTFRDATTNWADKSCVPVRLTFEATQNPFSPTEKPQQPVKLADGRTLQIYASSDTNCTMRWKSTQLDPVRLAALFQSAQSY